MSRRRIFQVEQDGSVLVVTIKNSVGSFAEVDVTSELETILPEVKAARPRGVVVDFGEVAYFGSTILEALRTIWNEVHASGGKMALCNLNDVGREIIELSKFDTIWPICDSRPAAVAAVSS